MAFTLSDTVSGLKTNLGLGTAADLDVGTGANNVVQLDSEGKIPALDASALTNVTIPAFNEPAYEYYKGTNSYHANGTWHNFGTLGVTTANFDTDSLYDTSNGKFTPNVAGYYYFYASIMASSGQDTDINSNLIRGVKNGTVQILTYQEENGNRARRTFNNLAYIVYMNGTTDNWWWDGYQNQNTGSPEFFNKQCWCGGFRLG